MKGRRDYGGEDGDRVRLGGGGGNFYEKSKKCLDKWGGGYYFIRTIYNRCPKKIKKVELLEVKYVQVTC
jgi:hypothetical protein